MKKIYTVRNVFQQQTHLWDKHTIAEEVAACSRRNIRVTFLKYLPKDEPILEAGCGLGAWVIYLSEKGYDIAGIDNNEAVIEQLKAWNPSLKVMYGDIRKLPYDDNSLGAYISLGVVEHFEEGCGEAMKEAYRVLRPGGLVFLTVPMNNIFRKAFAHHIRSLYLFWSRLRNNPAFFAEYRYSRRETEELLKKYGFDPVFSTWDDFDRADMSLGLWADFPPLQSPKLYRLNLPGRLAAVVLNSTSRWTSAAGVFCLARKRREESNEFS
ncbi:MAG TPA: methyltransferase domain-containing protein [Nitrospirota bacterium]|nr:methyltransferase domain-containing protein [Nitrospirota bacterium]